MLIILEGLDKTGKTTFAKKFNNAVYLHSDKDTNTISMLDHAIKLSKNKLVILDRSFMSEIAYGTVFRKQIRFDKYQLNDMIKKLQEIPHIVFYFNRAISECKFEDNEFESNTAKLTRVKYLYNNFIATYKDKLNIYEVKYYG